MSNWISISIVLIALQEKGGAGQSAGDGMPRGGDPGDAKEGLGAWQLSWYTLNIHDGDGDDDDGEDGK